MGQAFRPEKAGARRDVPIGVHKGGNAGVGGTGQPATLLHGPQHGEGEVLLGRG